MNKEEILKALEVIKNVCSELKPSCLDCPFYSEECGCYIMSKYPHTWKIQGKDGWRAFYDK